MALDPTIGRRTQKEQVARALISAYQNGEVPRRTPSFGRTAKGLGTLVSTILTGHSPGALKKSIMSGGSVGASIRNYPGNPNDVNADIPFFFNNPAKWGQSGRLLSSEGGLAGPGKADADFWFNWKKTYAGGKDTSDSLFVGGARPELRKNIVRKSIEDVARGTESPFEKSVRGRMFPAEHGMYPDKGVRLRGPGKGVQPTGKNPPAKPFSGPPAMNPVERLQKLRDQKKRGLITDEEYKYFLDEIYTDSPELRPPKFGDLPPESEFNALMAKHDIQPMLKPEAQREVMLDLLRKIYNPSDRAMFNRYGDPYRAVSGMVQPGKRKSIRSIWERNY